MKASPGSASNMLAIRIAAIFVLSVIVGGLLTPFLFNVLVWAGRTLPGCEGLRNILFEKVANRVVMLSVLGGAFVMLRQAGLTTLEAQGFARGIHWKKQLGTGFAVGALTMLALVLFAWASKAYILREEWSIAFPLRMLGNLVGAMLIGYLEEWLFRGVIFGALRKAYGLWPAAITGSAFFSLVHFARTENPTGVVHGRWYSAFELMPHMFSGEDIFWGYEGFKMATLFFMGLSLCFFYARYGNLYAVVGLHAGWVWIMRFCDYAFQGRNQDILLFFFGPTPGIAKSGGALIMSIVFTLLAIALYYCGNPDRKTLAT